MTTYTEAIDKMVLVTQAAQRWLQAYEQASGRLVREYHGKAVTALADAEEDLVNSVREYEAEVKK